MDHVVGQVRVAAASALSVKISPVVHQEPTTLEQVRPRIRRLDLFATTSATATLAGVISLNTGRLPFHSVVGDVICCHQDGVRERDRVAARQDDQMRLARRRARGARGAWRISIWIPRVETVTARGAPFALRIIGWPRAAP